MEEKNPYVTTIGFNKNDSDHVYVADFFCSMGRRKGQYIVKAITAYHNPGGMASGHVGVPAVDYEKIREVVQQILEERVNEKVSVKMNGRIDKKKKTHQKRGKGFRMYLVRAWR